MVVVDPGLLVLSPGEGREDLVCGVCHLVLQQPNMGCPEGHSFCQVLLPIITDLVEYRREPLPIAPRSAGAVTRYPAPCQPLTLNCVGVPARLWP